MAGDFALKIKKILKINDFCLTCTKNTDENWTEKVALDTAMNYLGEREKRIIYLRYYEGKTQTEISQEVGISQAQVSRLEKTALKEIKNSIRA